MKKRLILGCVLFLAIGVFVTVLHASRDAAYTSWEVMQTDTASKTMYVRFRINIPYTIEYIKQRIADTESLIRSTTDPNASRCLQELDELYLQSHQNAGRQAYPSHLGFGDFNTWKTAVSSVPNTLERTSSNPDTWYTKTLVPMQYYTSATKKYRYKFVIDYGTLPDAKRRFRLYRGSPL
jgi:hypothetical protein